MPREEMEVETESPLANLTPEELKAVFQKLADHPSLKQSAETSSEKQSDVSFASYLEQRLRELHPEYSDEVIRDLLDSV